MKNEYIWREELNISGSSLVSTFKELIHEGDIRRITIKNEQGKTLIEIPLLIGTIVVLAAPVVAAIGAIGAITGRLTIVIEREDSTYQDDAEKVVAQTTLIEKGTKKATGPDGTRPKRSEQLEILLEAEAQTHGLQDIHMTQQKW